MKRILLIVLIFSTFLEANRNNSPIESTNIVSDTINMLKSKNPEYEYNMGIELATTMNKDEIYPINDRKVIYLTNILNNLVLSSEKPYIYDGYKLLLVKNDSFNAFALPGGIIIINDGLFKYLENEDQLAVIISHEIGHIQERHSIETNKGSILNDIAKISAALAVSKKIENNQMQALAFNISTKMTNSIENGYNVDMEAEADSIGAKIMNNAGYDPNEFINVLNKLKIITNNYGGANYPEDRVNRLENILKSFNHENNLENKNLRKIRFARYK